jgi:Lon protease-like protein
MPNCLPRATIRRIVLDEELTLDSNGAIDFDLPIPVFPLPNLVLLPVAIQPLHIFEPRYREMVAHVLTGRPYIALAFLEPGYEARYYTHLARIRPIVCVGRLLRHEKLDDGRYNILLQGVTRARVLSEDQECSYRRGLMRPLPPADKPAAAADSQIRRRLLRLIEMPHLHGLALRGRWREILACRSTDLSDAVDLLASAVCGSPHAALKFLEEPCVSRRIEMLVEELKASACRATPLDEAAAPASRGWPRTFVYN